MATEIEVTPLGAGQDVGRSCLLVRIGGKNVMLDCGMHMGFQDERRFPDFSFISGPGSATEAGLGSDAAPLTEHLDAVIISHFHLDHCGALPYMTEMVGYKGPIYMTTPTKAIAPILLEDMRKVAVERKGETNFFTSGMIKECMRKVVAVSLHEVVQVDEELEIKAYYAGHVLGAAMFQIRVGSQSIVYTGDFNMTPDRHLGAAWIDKCRPDLLITESTYATTIRDSKRCRERDFLKKVHDCVDKGGKVLIPVFALGRAQELCILLETYWERMNIKVPIYFSTGLTERANNYYKMFITWTNEKIRKTFVERNMFDFKHIKGFDRSYINNPGPMVVFATPGMLHGGLSLTIFEEWCTSEANMIIMPGYCVSGTVGHKILNGTRKLEIKKGKMVEVKMSVQYMSFSAHADAKGIMQLITYCKPKNVMLVHGEAVKMEFLKQKIKQEHGVECYMPANGQTVKIATKPTFTVSVDKAVLADTHCAHGETSVLHGALLVKDAAATKAQVLSIEDACREASIPLHTLRFTMAIPVPDSGPLVSTQKRIYQLIKSHLEGSNKNKSSSSPKIHLSPTDGEISVSRSVLIKVEQSAEDEGVKDVVVSWSDSDEAIGSAIQRLIQNIGC